MSFVIGRGTTSAEDKPTGRLGTYRAVDGSTGAALSLDLDGPHAMLVVGKRGYGKSYTLGVIAESLATARGVGPVILDPMGVFETLAEESATGLEGDTTVPATVIDAPAITPTALDPRSWCALLGLSPESGAGGILWQAARHEESIPEMQRHVEESDAPEAASRAAINHLALARDWGIFDADGLDAVGLATSGVTVLDLSGLAAAPMNAVCRGVAEGLYRARVTGKLDRLPWLLVDEAHTFFDGIAGDGLELLLTRGRAPGVSLVCATQRPSAVPAVAISQSDVLLAHRLTARQDLDALDGAQPTYLDGSLDERLPSAPGEVLIVDDATETVHTATIRERYTPHGGESPSASALADEIDGDT